MSTFRSKIAVARFLSKLSPESKRAFVPGPPVEAEAQRRQEEEQAAAQQQAAAQGQPPPDNSQQVVEMLDMFYDEFMKQIQSLHQTVGQQGQMIQQIAASGPGGKPKKKSAEERLAAIEQALGIPPEGEAAGNPPPGAEGPPPAPAGPPPPPPQ